jgi:predicted permease
MWSILPILLLFVLGFFLQRTSVLTDESVAGIKRIVSDLALPALMFQAFSSLEIERAYLLLVATMFIVCLAMVALGKLLARPLHFESPYFPLLLGGFEMGMLGYALFIALYGAENLGKIALVDLGQVLFVFFVLIALLLRQRDGATDPKILLKKFLTSPVIVAIFAGIVMSRIDPKWFANPMGTVFGDFVDLLANLTVPLIALSIGYGIHVKRDGLALALRTIAVRKILLLAIGLTVNRFLVSGLLGMDPSYRYAVLVMFLTPPPFIITIYVAKDDKENAKYVDNTLSLDTLVSILLVTVASAIYV